MMLMSSVMLAIDHQALKLLDRLRAYAETVLHVPIDTVGSVPTGKLPGFIVDRYALIEAWLLDRRCLLIVPATDTADTPDAIGKHLDRLAEHFPNWLPILVMDTITPANRHRFIQRHIAFIVPGTQLFVPQLALDLREYFAGGQAAPRDILSAPAQMLVLACFNGFDLDSETATTLRNRYGYSAMTMSRVLDELEGRELIETHQMGRHRVIAMPLKGKKLWKRARPLLASPVKQRRQVPVSNVVEYTLLAGESALARLTDLGSPRRETLAIGARDWQFVREQLDVDRTPRWDEQSYDLQIWTYDPRAVSHGRDTVDPVSLWLSLPELADERYKMAKAQLLKQAGL